MKKLTLGAAASLVLVVALVASIGWGYNTPCPQGPQHPCDKCPTCGKGCGNPPPDGPPKGGDNKPNKPNNPPPFPNNRKGPPPPWKGDPVSLTGPDIYQFSHDFDFPLVGRSLNLMRTTILIPGYWEKINARSSYVLGGANASLNFGVNQYISDFVPKPFGSWHNDPGSGARFDAVPNALAWHNLMSLVYLYSEPGDPAKDDFHYSTYVFDTNSYQSLWLPPDAGLTQAQYLMKHVVGGSEVDNNYPGALWFSGFVSAGTKPDGGPAFALNPDGGTKFVLMREHDGRYTYGAAYGTPYEAFYNLAPRRFYLTRFEPIEYGGAGYRISYAQPTNVTCPQGTDAGTPGAPYINELSDDDGGSRARFVWKLVPTVSHQADAGVPDNECVIDHIDVWDVSNSTWVPQVQYGYDAGAGDVGGWVSSAQKVNQSTETYSWTSHSNYTRAMDGLSWIYSLNGSDLVTQAQTPYENFLVSSSSSSASVSWTTGSGGIDGGAISGVNEVIGLLQMNNGWHGMLPGAQDAGCPGSPYSCSAGAITNVLGTRTAGYGSYASATSAKNGFFHTFIEAGGQATGLGFDTASELRQETWGGTNSAGTGALEVQNYTYAYGGTGQSPRFYEQLANTSSRTSNSGSGSATRTWVYEDGGTFTNRLKADIQTGSVLASDGGWTTTSIATFYFTRHSACDSTADDPYGRTLEVHGPCTIGSGATDCSGTYPVTTYAYYGGNGAVSGNKANRLATVTRYATGNGCSGALTTTYNDYDALGHAISITDANSSTTTFDYSVAGAVTPLLRSMTVDFGGLNLTTAFSYDNGKLWKVTYPKGNADVFCYRKEAVPSNVECLPNSGPLTDTPVYSAKTDGSGAWSELVKYTYEPNTGTLAEADFWGCANGQSCGSWPDSSSTYELRRIEKYAFDAHRRPTWQGWGTGSGSFDVKRFFDRESNLAGVSLPSIGAAPAFCSGPSSLDPDLPSSKLCASLKNDAADRLIALTVYADGTTPTTTCFAHDDAQGNVTAVLPGQGNTCPGSMGTNNAGTAYTYDDFGRLARVTASWAYTGSAPGSGRGSYVYIYDALGDVVQAFTPALTALNSTYYRGYSYDQLGRLLSATVSQASTATLYSLQYDTAPAPGVCLSGWAAVNANGRLAMREDPTGQDVYYQYDGAGRIIAESRPVGCFSSSVRHQVATFYNYDKNGNTTQITYPLGQSSASPPTQVSRSVTYNYGSDASQDRVDSVSATRREAGAWVTYTVADRVRWEPFGGLRSYRATPPGGSHFVVENLLGDDGTTLPSSGSCQSLPSAASSDHTGRLRAVWVSAGDDGGVGDIYNRGFAWNGDQPTQVTTCLLGSNSNLTKQVYGYDNAGQLISVDGGYPKTGTAGYSYALDARGNRTSWSESGGANSLTTTYNYGVSGYVPDMLVKYGRQETLIDGGIASSGRNFQWDQEGRIIAETFDAGSVVKSAYNYSYLQGVGTTFYGYQVGGSWYYANVDVFSRRVMKTYPSGYFDQYEYDLGHQMLEDRGLNTIAGTPANYVMDDYIWLGGRPIIVVRGKLTTTLVWQDDTSTGCGRNDDPAPPNCGFYYIVTDHLGAPVAMLDSQARLTATNDYDAFGYVNRGGLAGQATVTGTVAYKFASYKVPHLGSFTTDTRVKFAGFANSSGAAKLEVSPPLNTVISTLSANSTYPTWTPWGNVPGSVANPATVDVWFAPVKGTVGAVLEAYEFRRYQSGANYFTVPLRFAGQYFDVETDHVENWNRSYDPQSGRYFAGEPLLETAEFGVSLAAQAVSPPTYSYAANRPTSFADSNGQDFFSFLAPNGLTAATFLSWFAWLKFHPPGDPLGTGSDKFAHCMAHCDAAKNGDYVGAFQMGVYREMTDLIRHSCGDPTKKDEGLAESIRDLSANIRGLEGAAGAFKGVAGHGTCLDACASAYQAK
ncbi:MAG: RHS repeat-associated core domain-containing protein [Myxococcaceae bacterium]